MVQESHILTSLFSLSESSLKVYRFLPREFSLFAFTCLGHALVKMQNNQQAWLQLNSGSSQNPIVTQIKVLFS